MTPLTELASSPITTKSKIDEAVVFWQMNLASVYPPILGSVALCGQRSLTIAKIGVEGSSEQVFSSAHLQMQSFVQTNKFAIWKVKEDAIKPSNKQMEG